MAKIELSEEGAETLELRQKPGYQRGTESQEKPRISASNVQDL